MFSRPQVSNCIKKETLAQMFSCEFSEISKNTFFTEHLWATASDRRTSNRLLEMQSVKPPKSCSILQGYKIVHSDTLSQLVTSSTPCIQCKEESLHLYQIDTSRAGLKEYLKLYCDNEKNFSTSCSFESKDTASVSTNVSWNISDINLRASYAVV